ncbi:hypothetical protein [Streptomyces yangpuensis]|uniref:hypothetical protein n=1 Tax=Streptomyces yangpuensis TaxID=1648182 RepID=UPI003716F73A
MALMLDWRGTPIKHRAHVLFPRKWGRSAHSTEMVEGIVQSFGLTGRITVDVLRTSRPRETGGTGRTRYAVPAHSVTVLPDPAPFAPETRVTRHRVQPPGACPSRAP